MICPSRIFFFSTYPPPSIEKKKKKIIERKKTVAISTDNVRYHGPVCASLGGQIMEARNVYTFVELAHALKTVLPNYTKGRVGHSCCIPRYRKYRLSTDIYVARIFPSALYSRGREGIGIATTTSNRKKIRRKLR